MTAFLRVTENGRLRDVAVIPPGQSLIIGRSDQADVAFPQDSLMSSRHLSVQIQNELCRIIDLGSTNGTTVNGERIESAAVGRGDVFRCGTTEFSVEWPGVHKSQATSSPSVGAAQRTQEAVPSRGDVRPQSSAAVVGVASAAAGLVLGPDIAPDRGFCGKTAAEILRRFRLRQSIPLTPEDGESPETFLMRLQTLPDGTAELEFLAFALPKRCAVWWLILCVRMLPGLTEEETAVLQFGERWVFKPSDANRRAVLKAAEDGDPGRAAHWVAMSAFYSDGSIAPESAPAVLPKDRVAGQSVFAGVTLTALVGPLSAAKARRKELARLGQKVAVEGISISGGIS